MSQYYAHQYFHPSKGVFANRDVNFSNIDFIGFDMDYTLAKYRSDAIEDLQHTMAKKSLVVQSGYPKELLKIGYRSDLIIRGLILDKKLGHLIKTDIQRYAYLGMHGTKMLTQTELRSAYKNDKIRIDSERFITLDTLFSIPEITLFCQLVKLLESQGRSQKIDFTKIYNDCRRAIDDLHQAGEFKPTIGRNIEKFICKSFDTALLLHRLKKSGKKLFLLTNSHFWYTNQLMSYLLENTFEQYPSWESFFDVIIVNAQKPDFFTGKKPFLDLKRRPINSKRFTNGKIYQEGNIQELEKMAGFYGEQILYVGDHIYGDILVSRKDTLWRTCLVVEELKEEIDTIMWHKKELKIIRALEKKRYQLDLLVANESGRLLHLEGLFHVKGIGSRAELNSIKKKLSNINSELKKLDSDLKAALKAYAKFFHPKWGQLMSEQYQLSHFGSQVKNYACIYTSDVENLLPYATKSKIRAAKERMSHHAFLKSFL